jgi:hypothetical protein
MRRLSVSASLLLTTLALGCEGPPQSLEPPQGPAQGPRIVGDAPPPLPIPPEATLLVNPNRSVLGPPVEDGRAAASNFSYTDVSGLITTKIWLCLNAKAASFPIIQCSVDADYVLVGGGAWADPGTGPGAFLTASYPADVSQLLTWEGRSKEHAYPNPHILSVYAIGMKITGVSRSDLVARMTVSQMTSDIANHPSATAATLPGILLSGGCRDNWHGAGNMLTTCGAGTAQGKDHNWADPSSVTVYAIAIDSSVPVAGALESVNTVSNQGVGAGSLQVKARLADGFVPTGFVGISSYSGFGRMLTQLAPNNIISSREFFAQSKDQIQPDVGTLTMVIHQLRKRP